MVTLTVMLSQLSDRSSASTCLGFGLRLGLGLGLGLGASTCSSNPFMLGLNPDSRP